VSILNLKKPKRTKADGVKKKSNYSMMQWKALDAIGFKYLNKFQTVIQINVHRNGKGLREKGY
jgi:hypothetical protein